MDEKKKENNVSSNKKTEENVKIKVGTVGNYLLTAFVLIIIGTGTLTYYLIHSAKDDYDKQYNDIVANITAQDLVEDKDDEDDQGDTIANIIDSAIADAQANANGTATEDQKKLMNESLVVLYNGLLLDTSSMDEVTLKYIDTNQPESDKYVITYYSYENYSQQDIKLGTFSQSTGDGLVTINGVGKVAISEDYDAIPRIVKVVNTVPSILTDNNKKIADYDTVKTLIVDLDGNGTEEYILVLANKTTGYSKITLFNSEGTKINDLASIDKSKWKKDSAVEFYLSINNVEILDVDNDGIMELLVEIPHATGNPTVSLLKYNNGILDGKTNIECSLLK